MVRGGRLRSKHDAGVHETNVAHPCCRRSPFPEMARLQVTPARSGSHHRHEPGSALSPMSSKSILRKTATSSAVNLLSASLSAVALDAAT
jgi:hypothetical protein